MEPGTLCTGAQGVSQFSPGNLIYTEGPSAPAAYIQVDGPWTGITDLVSYRDVVHTNQMHYLAKIVALGYSDPTYCTIAETWNTPDTYSFTALEETKTLDGPTYYLCHE